MVCAMKNIKVILLVVLIVIISVPVTMSAIDLGRVIKEEYIDSNATEEDAGDGVSINCDEGNSGQLDIPFVGVNLVELHEKHHWNMPAEKTGVSAVLSWNDQSWNLRFSLGIGDCPDNGELMVSDTGSSGLIELFFEDSRGFPEEQWFVHIETTSPESHRGESCNYNFEIVLF